MRILGIDLGSSSIKAVEMDSSFGRYDVHDHHEKVIPIGMTPEEALAQLMSSFVKQPDRIIIALPSSQTTLRNLQLPTRDKKALQAGVGFELEDELPFSLEDAVFDYTLLAQTKQQSTLHVSATLKKHLVRTIQRWESGNVEPDAITSEAWAFRILLNRVLSPAAQESPVLLAQMGHTKTVLYLHWKGSPVLIREIPWGGQDITAAIGKKFDLPIEQAETFKLDHGFVGDPGIQSGGAEDPSIDQSQLSQCIVESLQPLLHELRQMGLMSKNITRHSLSLLYLSGGTSLLSGIAGFLDEKLQVTTKPLLALTATTTAGVTYSEQSDAQFLLATSLTLALVGPDRALCINFRKGPFVKQGKSREFNLKALRKPLIAAGTVAFCLFLSLMVQSSVYKSRLAATDKQLDSSIKAFFGGIAQSAIKIYLADTGKLKTSVNKELNKHREMARLFGPNSRSTLDFLNSISTAIPKDVTVDLILFQVGTAPTEPFSSGDPSSASLTFTFSNPQTAEKLAGFLNSKMTHIQKSKIEDVIAEGAPKKFKITFSGKPAEESYGR